jgi:hypothetical protein
MLNGNDVETRSIDLNRWSVLTTSTETRISEVGAGTECRLALLRACHLSPDLSFDGGRFARRTGTALYPRGTGISLSPLGSGTTGPHLNSAFGPGSGGLELLSGSDSSSRSGSTCAGSGGGGVFAASVTTRLIAAIIAPMISIMLDYGLSMLFFIASNPSSP